MSYSRKTFMSNFSLNRVIWLLTFSDIFTWGILLIINVFLGLYLAEKFGTKAIEIVGIGTACFYLARVITQIPVGIITDRIKKDRDDIIFLITGNVLMGIPFLLLPTITTPFAFYVLQFIIGFLRISRILQASKVR